MANEKAWIVNEGQYAIYDHESKTRFEPGEPIRAELTTFAKAQPTLRITLDPNGDGTDKEKDKVQKANAEADAAREAAARAAELAQAEARGETKADALGASEVKK